MKAWIFGGSAPLPGSLLFLLCPKLSYHRGPRADGNTELGPHLELGAEWSAWRKAAVV